MCVSAIQQERDVIGKRRKLDDETCGADRGGEFLRTLINSETLCAQLRHSVIKSTGVASYDQGRIKCEKNEQIATLNDVGSSIHQQLLLIVEWAKSLKEFRALPLNDQVSVARARQKYGDPKIGLPAGWTP